MIAIRGHCIVQSCNVQYSELDLPPATNGNSALWQYMKSWEYPK